MGIAAFSAQANGALVVPGNPVTTAHLKLILTLAERYRMPVVGGYRSLAAEGGLASFGADVNEQYRGAAGYIDRVLKGEKPADLPVQQPTKYELRLNLRTAKALGLEVPLFLQQLADQVIE
jgi:putative ABC transport system substrate-binding protein